MGVREEVLAEEEEDFLDVLDMVVCCDCCRSLCAGRSLEWVRAGGWDFWPASQDLVWRILSLVVVGWSCCRVVETWPWLETLKLQLGRGSKLTLPRLRRSRQ